MTATQNKKNGTFNFNYIPVSSSRYVHVSMCVDGFPGTCFLRGMMMGGTTAPAHGILSTFEKLVILKHRKFKVKQM